MVCGPPYDETCVQDQHGQGRVLDYMAKTALIAVYAQAGSALSAYPSGVASDKWGRKPLVYMACLGMGGIYLFMGCNKGTPENLAMLLGFFWGVCNGCFVAVDFAIAIDTLPDKNDAARYLGVWGVSAFVGTTLGPITGGLALYFLGALRQARHLPDGSSICPASDRSVVARVQVKSRTGKVGAGRWAKAACCSTATHGTATSASWCSAPSGTSWHASSSPLWTSRGLRLSRRRTPAPGSSRPLTPS